jgi:hypothetical protein
MAAGAGLPLGSVGVSLKKILASGAVKSGERGMYQLGSAIGASVIESAPTKKAKPTSSKKVKAATAEASVAQEVKSKPAKKTKTTTTKKAKPVDAPSTAEAALV